MRKDELRKLRTLNATPGMLTAMKSKDATYYYARAQCLGKIVKIALFKQTWLKRGVRSPECEVFINRDGKEWISRILNEQGEETIWSEAMIWNLPIDMRYWNEIWVTKDTAETAKSFDRTRQYIKGHCLSAVWSWQSNIRAEHIQEQEKKETGAWDEEMKLVPETPKGLEEWMHRECNDDFWLIYEYKPGQKMAYCSRCKNTVTVDGLKNGVMKVCPKCHAAAVCKPAGKMMQTQETKYYYARVIQKIKDGIVERLYVRDERYRGRNYDNPRIHMQEIERVLIREGQKTVRYLWRTYKNKYQRWCRDYDWKAERYRSYGRDHAAKIYPPTMREAKKSGILKKSSYALWQDPPLTLAEYLIVEQGNPAVEMLSKIGLFDLAEDIMATRYDKDLLKEDETELAKMLKIDNMRLKRLRAMDKVGLKTLKWMQREKAQDVIWPDEMIEGFAKEGLEPKSLTFLPHMVMSEVQVWNYLKKQAAMMGESIYQTRSTWDDYLSMAESMKMDVRNTRILKPKDLKYAHDELVMLKNTKNMEQEAKKIEKKWPKVKGQLSKLQKFEFQDEKYCVIAPKSILDIVREGRVLQHCVHTCDYYFQRITNDESYLFFLRRMDHPDMPWYTMEVEPSGNIRQKRTTGDRQNKDFEAAVGFLKKWQQYFRKKLTKKEKELGIVADRLRKKNYKELREQAKRVWHGPLAGQLLADVLEADFMEAI